VGSATWTSAGKFASALSFNGSNARVTVADSSSLDLTTGMTLEAWVFPTAGGGWRDVVYKGQDDIYYLESSSAGGQPATGGTFATGLLTASLPLPLNTWTHLAATYDGQMERIYVNGAQAGSRAQTGPIATSSGPLSIGGDALYGQYFAGRIDEVRIYNQALSESQIQTDMATPADGGPDTTPPTVAMTAPNPGSPASHVVPLSANASDDVAVQSVEFFADGTSLGSDIAPPYTMDWDSTAVSNGPHTLTAVARDAAGNQTTSAGVSVTTANPVFVNETVVPGITAATTIAFLPGGRMLVGELTEKIWVVQPGATQPDPTPFLQLNASQLIGEQGLMDILPDPNFAQNGFYYVFYTRGAANQQNHNGVSRFTASGNGTVAGSEVRLWEEPEVASAEHHGGSLAFGADGKLYITYGDQFGSQSQDLTNFRGKVLRINKDGSVPTDNPFYDGAGPNRDAIWAYGLRNPFRMSVDPVTGNMYIGDVGGNDPNTAIEEVNLGAAGANYGWPLCEGDCGIAGVTGPIFEYPHLGRDASITGGVVYRGTQFPSEYQGSYFFGDYVQNTIRRLKFDGQGNVSRSVNFWPADGAKDTVAVGDPVKFLEGPDGALYYVDIGFNDAHEPNPASIRRIRYVSGNQPPTAVADANPKTGLPPLQVTFSSAGSIDPEGQSLTYSWTFGDGSTSTQANPSHTYQTSGQYTARVTVSDGESSTISNNVTIKVGTPPTATILTPADASLFRAGDAISYSGNATDAEDGTLPASAFSWSILFHHDSHVHPAGGPFTNTKTGTLQIPVSGHDFQGTTSYEIVLTVTDSDGLTASTSVTVVPDKVNLSFDSVPSGLTLEIDGISKQTPFVFGDVKGFQHTINAPAQLNGGNSYTFSSWSDGGAQSHGIVVPNANQSYVATFQASTGSPNLAAAYAFNEGLGTTTADASGNGNNGTIGSATWIPTGKYGNALSFNGTSARVTVPDSNSLDLTTGMTLEAWVFPTAGGGWRDVIFKTDDIYYLEGSSTGGPPATGGTFTSPLVGTSALPLNVWSHLSATYDGATLRLYANAVQVASRPLATPISTSAGALTIGGDALFGQYFAGRIDEVRIYNVARSVSELQADMNTPIGNPGPDTQPPTAPSGLSATPVSATQINLAWTASTDNVGVTGYKLERCQGATCTNFVEVATPPGTTYNDTGLTGATTYRYRVRATDAATNLSPYSSIQSATTADTQPPTAPTGLTATAISPSQINLAWTASTDNVGVTGYRVERCQGAGCTDFVEVATPSGTAYNDTLLQAATGYSYRVRATDAANNLSPYSSVQSATTLTAEQCGRSSAVWLTGMEHGVVSVAGGGIFTTVTGVPTADSTVARTGAYSLQIADASAGSTVRALRSFTASSVIVSRFAVRLSSLPTVTSNLAYIDSGTDLVFRYNAASQRLELVLGTSIASSTTTVSPATWYMVDLRYDLSANLNLGNWRVNGVAQTQVSRNATPATANGFGMGATANPSVYTANFDDIVVSSQPTAYPLEDSRIVRLAPNSMGTSSGAGNFRNNDGTTIDANSWQRLDEAPMTSSGDYVRQQANSGTSFLEFGLEDTPETCIRDISAVLAYHAAGNAADNGKASIFDGATETVNFSGDMSQTSLQYKSAIVTPAAGIWGQAALNGVVARAGYSTDSTPNPYWDSILLEAAVP
jgi:glucose/arabinose dehydrogenase/chitodextrinase